jgi:hypothetical protein
MVRWQWVLRAQAPAYGLPGVSQRGGGRAQFGCARSWGAPGPARPVAPMRQPGPVLCWPLANMQNETWGRKLLGLSRLRMRGHDRGVGPKLVLPFGEGIGVRPKGVVHRFFAAIGSVTGVGRCGRSCELMNAATSQACILISCGRSKRTPKGITDSHARRLAYGPGRQGRGNSGTWRQIRLCQLLGRPPGPGRAASRSPCRIPIFPLEMSFPSHLM